MKEQKYKITYFYNGLDDYGYPVSGYNTIETSDINALDYYRGAYNGKTFGSEYIKTKSIKRI